MPSKLGYPKDMDMKKKKKGTLRKAAKTRNSRLADIMGEIKKTRR